VTLLRYGPHPSQHGQLSLPAGSGPWPVAVVVHGGFWRAIYGAEFGTDLAEDLMRHGVAAWNVEYRRVGNDPGSGGGGWPDSCLDVAAALDLLATGGQVAAGGQLDLSRVVAVGHSAGGQLAGWLAGRVSLAKGVPGASPLVPLTGVVCQAGVLDLELALRQDLGRGAVRDFMGGGADDPRARALASPAARLPLGLPSVCVHGSADDIVPLSQSESFVAAARRAGDDSRLVTLPGVDHFALIDVSTPAWAACRAAVLDLLAAPAHQNRDLSHGSP